MAQSDFLGLTSEKKAMTSEKSGFTSEKSPFTSENVISFIKSIRSTTTEKDAEQSEQNNYPARCHLAGVTVRYYSFNIKYGRVDNTTAYSFTSI